MKNNKCLSIFGKNKEKGGNLLRRKQAVIMKTSRQKRQKNSRRKGSAC